MYTCSACNAVTPTWMGKCSQCGEWDTLLAKKQEPKRVTSNAAAAFATTVDEFGGDKEAIQLPEIKTPSIGRMSTGIGELDRVLGGGLVVGSVVFVGGDPGIGKSTLMMQATIGIGERVLYATSEESAYQCKLSAERVVEGIKEANFSEVNLSGEAGLGGEVRCVPQIEQRVAQVSRREYKKTIVPITQQEFSDLGCIGVGSIGDLEGFIEKNEIDEICPINSYRTVKKWELPNAHKFCNSNELRVFFMRTYSFF